MDLQAGLAHRLNRPRQISFDMLGQHMAPGPNRQVDAIEADLNETDLSGLDAELEAIENDLLGL